MEQLANQEASGGAGTRVAGTPATGRSEAVAEELRAAFPDAEILTQETRDEIPTCWVAKDRLRDVLRHLKNEAAGPYRLLYDLTAIDERQRSRRDGQPAADFTAVYHLLSFDRNEDMRLKVALEGEYPSLPTITDLWANADWYEREAWDMFGITFDGHPNLRRILMPDSWQGHPLRKDHPARATEMGPFELTPEKVVAEHEALEFKPEEWGLARRGEDTDFMFLNLGPQHPEHDRRL